MPIAQPFTGDVRLQLENATKKKERGSKKIKARFLTGANLRAEFERQDAERREQEHIAAEKGKQKDAETAERAQRVADDALNRDFSGRLISYCFLQERRPPSTCACTQHL